MASRSACSWGDCLQSRQSPPRARPAPHDLELVPDQSATAGVQDRGPPGAARSVLSVPTRREPLHAAPLWADAWTHRATRVAPPLIASLTPGARAVGRRGRISGGVSKRDGRGGQTQKHGAGHGPCFARVTSGNVSGRANERTDGMVCSFNATGGSRQNHPKRRRRDGC